MPSRAEPNPLVTSHPGLPPLAAMQRAFAQKDASYDGLFVVAVKTTGIYCRPTCRAKPPRLENVSFLPSPAEAERAGFRACKLCRPTEPAGTAPPVVCRLVELVERDPARRWRAADLAELGIDPATARRQFVRHLQMTFAQYQRARRLGLAASALSQGKAVIDAQLSAGFDSGSGFREAFTKLFGAAPANSAHTPADRALALTADWIPTPLGLMVGLAGPGGVALLDFADRKGLPGGIARVRDGLGQPGQPAAVVPGRHPALELAKAQLQEYFAGDRLSFDLPLSPVGSGFEQQAWAFLQQIPPGQTRSYGEQAAALGRPGAARAVGRANGRNMIGLVIPCHRVVGATGQLTGYGGGLHRKRWLLEHERRVASGVANTTSSQEGWM